MKGGGGQGGGSGPYLVDQEGLPVSKVQLVPHHLHPLLSVHGQECALDPRHVSLIHLGVGGGGVSEVVGGGSVPSHILSTSGRV